MCFSRLSPIKGIKNHTDFISGVFIPNRTAYRSNLEETKKLQRQVIELMSKGTIHERRHKPMCRINSIITAEE